MTVEARNRTIPQWFERIRTRQIALPRFQRKVAWGPNLVSDLLTTVLRGLPCGASLILEVGDEPPFISREMRDAPKDGERITELLLDGQQRLTALWRSINDKYSDRTFLVHFIDDPHTSGHKMPEAVGIARYMRNGKRYPVWVDEPEQVWERDFVPARLLMPGDITHEIDQWIDAVMEKEVEKSREKERKIDRTIQEIRQTISNYNIPFLSLPASTPKEVSLDVFIKMNTSMVSLSTFDILVAQLEAELDESLHDLMAKLTAAIPRIEAFKKPEDLMLDVAALMQNNLPNQSGYWKLSLPQLLADWSIITRNIKNMLDFITVEGVFDRQRLPTDAVLAVIAALWHQLPTRPDQLGNATILLKKYLWRSFFTSRYEQSAAGNALNDYRALRECILHGADESNVPVLDDILYPLATESEIANAGWPKNRIILSRGLMTLSLKCGAHDIADGASANFDHVKGREYHHLFPDSLLQAAGVTQDQIYTACNCSLITWRTNRTISNKEPLAYLKERADNSTLGEEELDRRLKTHLIPFSKLSVGGYGDLSTDNQKEALKRDYQAYIESRAKLFHSAMLIVCNGREIEMDKIFNRA